jgi:tRNA/tmRNA/rRNA uracil-C5-methylase (TrmA/RlmC/RlmD family)
MRFPDPLFLTEMYPLYCGAGNVAVAVAAAATCACGVTVAT